MEQVEVWRGHHGDPAPPSGPLPGVRLDDTLAYEFELPARAVTAARQQHLGVWEQADPLRLLPFELRFVAERRPPHRWVIDLRSQDDVLLPPQAYHTISHPEDRLFVPAEFVPLFVEHGWRRGQL